MGKSKQEKRQRYVEWADSVRGHSCDVEGAECASPHEREDEAVRQLAQDVQKMRASLDRWELRAEAGKKNRRR